MDVIENLIISTILTTFPILLYEYFTLYRENIKKEKSDILLNVCLFVSLFLTMNYKENIKVEYHLITLMLPLMISYLNNKDKEALVISIIVSEYLINKLGFNLLFTIVLFGALYIAYKFYSTTNKKNSYFINISILLIVFTYLILFILNPSLNSLALVFLASISYIIIIKIVDYGIKEAKSVINMHMTLKDFEKEKNIKLNLFKITHEIKNPLAVIKGYLDMFDSKNEEKSKRYIKIIKGEVNRTLNLLHDFMEFTKIKVNRNEFFIGELIDDVKDALIPIFNALEVNYYFETEDNALVNLDYNRMKQVIINVIKNAVEACPPYKGQVSTTVFVDKDFLYIFVRDNGSGMTKDTLNNIMEPFYTTKEKGTGLGVSLSKEIIEAHKGNLLYDSKIGKGTVCKIVLPLKITNSNKDHNIVA